VKVVIVGCGRVGAELAEMFESGGYDVVILDQSTRAFDRLPDGFRGSAVRGDGTDEDTLRRAGADEADVFIAMTEGDNRNVMAAQLASEVLGARKVIAKINDPLRAKAYASLGIATLCRTSLMRDAVAGYVELPVSGDPGIYPPSGQHPGARHDGRRTLETAARSPIDLGAAPGEIATAGGAADDTGDEEAAAETAADQATPGEAQDSETIGDDTGPPEASQPTAVPVAASDSPSETAAPRSGESSAEEV
jgi:trk system potassium uptake protein TrkA